MRRVLYGAALVVVLAGFARGQDMPLSQILKDGEGWKEMASDLPRIDLLRVTGNGVTAYHGKGVTRVNLDGTRRDLDDAPDLERPA